MKTVHFFVNFEEIWTRGENRELTIKTLRNHIKMRFKLKSIAFNRVSKMGLQILVSAPDGESRPIGECLSLIPGISSWQRAKRINRNFDRLVFEVLEFIKTRTRPDESFSIRIKKDLKTPDIDKRDLIDRLAKEILSKHPQLNVDLSSPKTLIEIKVFRDCFYLIHEKSTGLGGLPVGSSGHALGLLSGGMDSPVACHQMVCRGLQMDYVFFYAYPYIGEETLDKIKQIFKFLARIQNQAKLYIFPFGDIQTWVAQNTPENYRTTILRAIMLLSSQRLLEITIGSQKQVCLVTGDSLGQVATQTLSHFQGLDQLVTHPILRPLCGYSKSQIIAAAKELGSHSLSTLPHQDACSLFAPKAPIINPKNSIILDTLAIPSLKPLIDDSLQNCQIYTPLGRE